MARYAPPRLNSLFSRGASSLANLKIEATRLDRILGVIHETLPESLNRHCLGAVVRNGTLVIFVDQPAWATRIRYQQTAILSALTRLPIAPVRRVRVKILPQEARPEPQPRQVRRRRISPKAREILRSSAAGIQDPELSDALRRLAEEQ